MQNLPLMTQIALLPDSGHYDFCLSGPLAKFAWIFSTVDEFIAENENKNTRCRQGKTLHCFKNFFLQKKSQG